MDSDTPPSFLSQADESVRRAFLGGHPTSTERLAPGTKLFKWTASIRTPKGVSAWWQFLQSRRLSNGDMCPGIAELQTYANRLGSHDRDYTRARMAVTNQWNPMTRCVAIELQAAKWGYIGKTAGQRVDQSDPSVYYIGGEYQVWVPGITANDFRQISILPYLTPNTAFGANTVQRS